MRAAILATVAAAVMILGALAWPAPADAAAAPCMTRAEFNRIHKGQSLAKVRAIVGASGTVQTDSQSPGYRYLSKSYRVCGSRYGSAMVAWTNHDTAGNPTGRLGVYAKAWSA